MSALNDVQRAWAESKRQAVYNRASENQQIAEYAREYVVATQAYEDDRYSPGWTERAGRAHLARAQLWGACGIITDFPETEPGIGADK